MPASVLAVVAHPDDESFGLGALLSSASRSGARAGVLCLTHGEASTLHGVDGDLRVVREGELRSAAKRLGLCWVRLLDHPDGAVADDQARVTADVAAAVDSFHPDVLLVFDPNGITGHPDHQAATRAAVAVGRRHDIDVVAWTLPTSVTEAMAAEGMTMFAGVPDDAVQLTVAVDRAAQLEAVEQHPSQAVPGSPLWRRLELLGDREHLRFLHSTGRAELPFGAPATAMKECTS
jgi:LmbE family N-acetylglucosaminyl deacetylase